MADWQTAETTQRLSDLVDAAIKDGPQLIMRYDTAVAVVLSDADYRMLRQQADANFAELLGRSPFGPNDIEPIGMSLAGED